jgi:hypothetical protein
MSDEVGQRCLHTLCLIKGGSAQDGISFRGIAAWIGFANITIETSNSSFRLLKKAYNLLPLIPLSPRLRMRQREIRRRLAGKFSGPEVTRTD